ncbi:MAG TPA: hypothetical protein VJA27_00165 [Patescibacteria group bacterium]|nr:hypothetical protein [Patescibacteria group bacterium]
MPTTKKLVIGIGITLVAAALVVGVLFGLPYFSASRNTTYASGYSADNFKRVTIGMPGGDVEKILGAPLSRSTKTDKGYLYYSKPNRETHYFERTIVLEQNSVVEVISKVTR